MFFKKVFYRFGTYREKFVVYRDAYALLTLTHTESSAEFDFVFKPVFGDKTLKSFHDLTRAFDVARTTDTNRYFYHIFLLIVSGESVFFFEPSLLP